MMAELTKEQKKELKRRAKEMMTGNSTGSFSGGGFQNSPEAPSPEPPKGEPGVFGILWGAVLEPLILVVVISLFMNYVYKDNKKFMVADNYYSTHSCREMMDALDKNPISAKNRFTGHGIKVIGCKISSIGQDGEIRVVPIEGVLNIAGIDLRLRKSDKIFAERISVGDRCVVWGTITGVEDAPFANYIMDVANMTAR